MKFGSGRALSLKDSTWGTRDPAPRLWVRAFPSQLKELPALGSVFLLSRHSLPRIGAVVL